MIKLRILTLNYGPNLITEVFKREKKGDRRAKICLQSETDAIASCASQPRGVGSIWEVKRTSKQILSPLEPPGGALIHRHPDFSALRSFLAF